MSMNKATSVSNIVRDAGGRIIGRTKLQKIAYFLSVTGLEPNFSFSYRHYGPYSEELANAARHSHLLGYLDEVEHPTSWGGSYSVYVVEKPMPDEAPEARRQLASAAARADAVELELAATAVFLSKEGFSDPWEETARRKPEKSESGRIERAKDLIKQLHSISTPTSLPDI